jgi:hypothetical protein
VAQNERVGDYGEGPEVFRALQVRYGVITEAGARLLTEEQGRREWLEGVRRRLGLVTEVHRCYVYDDDEGDGWAWFCRRRGCPGRGLFGRSHREAFAEALAHARSFVPEPLEEGSAGELEWDRYVPLLDALPWRVPGGE